MKKMDPPSSSDDDHNPDNNDNIDRSDNTADADGNNDVRAPSNENNHGRGSSSIHSFLGPSSVSSGGSFGRLPMDPVEQQSPPPPQPPPQQPPSRQMQPNDADGDGDGDTAGSDGHRDGFSRSSSHSHSLSHSHSHSRCIDPSNSCDPPEEKFVNPFAAASAFHHGRNSSNSSSSRKGRGGASKFYDGDDELDEFELEGLVAGGDGDGDGNFAMSSLSRDVPLSATSRHSKSTTGFSFHRFYNSRDNFEWAHDILPRLRSLASVVLAHAALVFGAALALLSQTLQTLRRRLPSSTSFSTSLARLPSSLLSACDTLWNPQNRAKSAIALLSLLLLCSLLLTVDDSRVRPPEGHTLPASHPPLNSDPLSGLSPSQRHSLLAGLYGYWGFYDGAADERPAEPYTSPAAAGNEFSDVGEEDFPDEAWQVDAVYVNHFLDAGEKLVRRGQEAMFGVFVGLGIENVTVSNHGGEEMEESAGGEEEGQVSGQVSGQIRDPNQRLHDRLQMFHLAEIDLATVTTSEYLALKEPHWHTKGGWTTQRSFDGLERRLLHAMMTNGNFTIVITGNWRNMGYGGNHVWQAMAGKMEVLLTELFQRLGVTLAVRAVGLPPLEKEGLSVTPLEAAGLNVGGRETLVHAMGWSSILGGDVDMVIWEDDGVDDDETNKERKGDEFSAQLFDFFARQALLAGTSHLPFLWGGNFHVLRNLHQYADVDVGQLGNGLFGVPETTKEELAYTLPWASQYLKCEKDQLKTACRKEEYQFQSRCWTGEGSATPQLDRIPILPTAVGWRMQQAKAYTAAYNLLAALLDAMDTWSERTIYEGQPLTDEYWHIGEYITNIREKVKALTEEDAPHCFQLEKSIKLPNRLCRNALKGRTEYTPRANPMETSIRSIVVPSETGATVAETNEMNPLEGMAVDEFVDNVPAGEVDPLELLHLEKNLRLRERYLGRRWLRTTSRTRDNKNISQWLGSLPDKKSSPKGNENDRPLQRRLEDPSIRTSNGWQLLHSLPGNDNCDGTLASTASCGVSPSSSCYLEGHQGARGGIWGDDTTGWLNMKVTEMECGYVALNLEIGGRKVRHRAANVRKLESERLLSNKLPDEFVFEYSVDNVVSTLDKPQFLERLEYPVPGMTLLTLVNDEASTTAKDVSIGVRVRGCSGVECQIGLTHVYWC
mmetsp:Transcript_12707/g.27031  ORF Transcript_12707/g.27031 Transcript_12707/m.27031 type:complete len:1165 (+) Transcript_12707:51-3545(+)